jgi:hypothetical protein
MVNSLRITFRVIPQLLLPIPSPAREDLRVPMDAGAEVEEEEEEQA